MSHSQLTSEISPARVNWRVSNKLELVGIKTLSQKAFLKYCTRTGSTIEYFDKNHKIYLLIFIQIKFVIIINVKISL
jgi:hypothetical protein